MIKNKITRILLVVVGAIILMGGGIGIYMFNAPHRNIEAADSDYTLKASDIVSEYLTDSNLANDKYLDEEGESKILEVKGVIASISTDFNNQKVILLKNENENAGVSCTFTTKTNQSVENLKEGQNIIVKGVIRSGASYDEDLEMYENVILEKCSLMSSKN